MASAWHKANHHWQISHYFKISETVQLNHMNWRKREQNQPTSSIYLLFHSHTRLFLADCLFAEAFTEISTRMQLAWKIPTWAPATLSRFKEILKMVSNRFQYKLSSSSSFLSGLVIFIASTKPEIWASTLILKMLLNLLHTTKFRFRSLWF